MHMEALIKEVSRCELGDHESVNMEAMIEKI
jgi:hypothetical protein